MLGSITPNISLHSFFSFSFTNNDVLSVYGKVFRPSPAALQFDWVAMASRFAIGQFNVGLRRTSL